MILTKDDDESVVTKREMVATSRRVEDIRKKLFIAVLWIDLDPPVVCGINGKKGVLVWYMIVCIPGTRVLFLVLYLVVTTRYHTRPGSVFTY